MKLPLAESELYPVTDELCGSCIALDYHGEWCCAYGDVVRIPGTLATRLSSCREALDPEVGAAVVELFAAAREFEAYAQGFDDGWNGLGRTRYLR